MTLSRYAILKLPDRGRFSCRGANLRVILRAFTELIELVSEYEAGAAHVDEQMKRGSVKASEGR